jgi:hypothetical protein
VAKVCRAEAQIVRDERNIEEEAKFLLLAEALEGNAAEHPGKTVQKLPESHGNSTMRISYCLFAAACTCRHSLKSPKRQRPCDWLFAYSHPGRWGNKVNR